MESQTYPFSDLSGLELENPDVKKALSCEVRSVQIYADGSYMVSYEDGETMVFPSLDGDLRSLEGLPLPILERAHADELIPAKSLKKARRREQAAGLKRRPFSPEAPLRPGQLRRPSGLAERAA